MNKKHKIILGFIMALVLILVVPLFIPLPSPRFKSIEEVPISSNNGRLIDINGYKTYIEDLNTQSNKVITFIHGFGGSTFTWHKNKEFFVSNGFRVILLDLKGFGISQKGINYDYSHSSQADLVLEILNTLNVDSTVVVGHSMGGNIATIFSQKYPNRVSSLVLVSAAIVENSQTSIFSNIIGNFPVKDWLKVIISYYFTKDRFSEFLSSAYNNKDVITQEVVDSYYLPLEINNWQDSLIGISRDSSKNAVPQPLSSVLNPTLIVWGNKDTWVEPDRGNYLNNKIPNSTLKTIENAGHLPMEEYPNEFNSILLEYLNSLN